MWDEMPSEAQEEIEQYIKERGKLRGDVPRAVLLRGFESLLGSRNNRGFRSSGDILDSRRGKEDHK